MGFLDKIKAKAAYEHESYQMGRDHLKQIKAQRDAIDAQRRAAKRK